MQSYSPSYSFEQALVKMEAWCAYQDRCLFEIQNKLNSWNIDFSVQEKIIEKLHELGYPEATEENDLLLQLKSYASCMIGRVHNMTHK
jgi:hypothetical protein